MLPYKDNEIIMIGDQLVTDILVANRSHIKSILVSPISKANDGSKFIKFLEKNIFKKLAQKNILHEGFYNEGEIGENENLGSKVNLVEEPGIGNTTNQLGDGPKKCIGCGKELQTTDERQPGYAIDIDRQNLCLRCFKIKHYNRLVEQEINDKDFIAILEDINKTKEKIRYYYVVDVFDLPGNLNGEFATVGLVNQYGDIQAKFQVENSNENIIQNLHKKIIEGLDEVGINFEEQVEKIGFACVGFVDHMTGIVNYSANLKFENFNLKKVVTDLFKKPVFVLNDANAAALDGKLIPGVNGHAGEFGHGGFFQDNVKCSCGLIGCIEATSSINGIENFFNDKVKNDKQHFANKIFDGIEIISFKNINDALMKNPKEIKGLIYECLEPIAKHMATMVMAIDPEAIIISGEVTSLGEVMVEILVEEEKNMKKRLLGNKLEVSEVGLGCMGLSMSFPPFPTREEAIEFIRKAYKEGVTFFDTAEIYGPFDNEEILGEAVKPFRDKVIIATKFGFKYEGNVSVGLDSTEKNILRAIEGSLKRLQTDYIDLYYQHRVDPKTPIEVVAKVVGELIKAKKEKKMNKKNLNLNALRMLGVQAVNKANSGHPGIILGAAPMVYELFTNVMNVNPINDQ
ncbi:hypothetical protein FQR65_LT17180 [Abscondita terminalis]|nr:hypothetical protein FQR65_LT17180 [Abscondita terminalis]